MIARKTIRELWPMFLIYLLVMELLLLPAIILWPDLKIIGDKLGPILSFTKFLGKSVFSDVIQAVGDYSDYFALQAFFKGANICGAAAAVLVGTGLIARERESLTLEFLMARPISTSRILFEKFSIATIGLTVPVFLVTWSGIPLSAWLVDEELTFVAVTIAAWHNSLFIVCMLALTTLCSVVFRLQAHVAAVAGVFIVSQVTLFFIQTARKFSLFQLSDIDVYAPILHSEVGLEVLLESMELWMLGAIFVLYFISDRLLRRIEL
jgi:ABC-type transport system involved in multi-copper enzyme maturation permease subunit